MRSSTCPGRRLSTLDVMILIVSTIPGLWWFWLTRGDFYDYLNDTEVGGLEWLCFNGLPRAAMIADPLLMGWTLAWCVLRIRGPRPRWRRLVRQPGFVVGLTTILAWFVGGGVAIRWWLDVHHIVPEWLDVMIVQMATAMMLGGFGVFFSWTGLVLEGRWRPERSWVDRLGRILGVGWIMLSVPSAILLRLHTEPFY